MYKPIVFIAFVSILNVQKKIFLCWFSKYKIIFTIIIIVHFSYTTHLYILIYINFFFFSLSLYITITNMKGNKILK